MIAYRLISLLCFDEVCNYGNRDWPFEASVYAFFCHKFVLSVMFLSMRCRTALKAVLNLILEAGWGCIEVGFCWEL